MTKTKNRQEHEDKPFDEDGSQGELVGDGPGPVESHNIVREVGIQAHCSWDQKFVTKYEKGGRIPTSGRQRNRHVGEQAHTDGRQSSNCSGRGDKISPDDVYTEAVFGVTCATRIYRIIAYASSSAVRDNSGIDLFSPQPGYNPNEFHGDRTGEITEQSERTDMMYAMAKKVVRPARTSVRKRVPPRSRRCEANHGVS